MVDERLAIGLAFAAVLGALYVMRRYDTARAPAAKPAKVGAKDKFIKKAMPQFGVHQQAAAHTGKPLKILCLHGMGGAGDMVTSSGHYWGGSVGHLKDYLGNLVEFVGVTAPHNIPMKNKAGNVWLPDDGDRAKWDTYWAESLRTLEDAIQTHGPFDGLLGFSMGGCCVPLLLAAVPEGTFRFIIVCDGYLPGKGDQGQSLRELLERRKPMATPALFTMGANDRWPADKLAEAVMTYFTSPEALHHPNGHIVPADEASLKQIAAFLLRQVPPS